MVNKSVNRRECHSLIGKDLSPFSEGLIGCDQQRAPFVAHTDELKQHARLRLILADIGKVIKNQEVILVDVWR